MEFLIKVNGYREKDKDLVSKYGLTVQNMLDSGKITKPMVKEPSTMQMEMCTKASG